MLIYLTKSGTIKSEEIGARVCFAIDIIELDRRDRVELLGAQDQNYEREVATIYVELRTKSKKMK